MFTEQERLDNVAALTIINARIEASEKEIAMAEGMLKDMKEMHAELVGLRDKYVLLMKLGDEA